MRGIRRKHLEDSYSRPGCDYRKGRPCGTVGHYSIRYDDETALLAEAQRTFPNTVASQEGMTISL